MQSFEAVLLRNELDAPVVYVRLCKDGEIELHIFPAGKKEITRILSPGVDYDD